MSWLLGVLVDMSAVFPGRRPDREHHWHRPSDQLKLLHQLCNCPGRPGKPHVHHSSDCQLLCHARRLPAGRASLHPRGSVFQDVHCSVQALAIVVRPDFLSRCLTAELAPDAHCHHACTTINAGLHLGSHHIVADMIVSSAHVQPFRFMFPHMGAVLNCHATWDMCLPLKLAMMASVARGDTIFECVCCRGVPMDLPCLRPLQ
jgi:hypothetical protein